MTTVAEWVEGARLRTLPAAVAPVLVGSGLAAWAQGFRWWAALLCLVVALAVQVGVNYANDYSDGVRGTDARRVGPRRLVASGLASPRVVLAATLVAFGVAAAAGLALAIATSWWLLVVGAVAMLAAWTYTGGSRPYGYMGLGELSVFVFFGLVAVVGTTYVQVELWLDAAVVAGAMVGALACAILVANNLRDVDTDRVAGKRTLAVLVGPVATRQLYVVLVVAALVGVGVLAALTAVWVLLGLLAVPLAIAPVRRVLGGAVGSELVVVLKQTALLELAVAALVTVGLVLA